MLLCNEWGLNEVMNEMTKVKKAYMSKYLSRVVKGCLVKVWWGHRNGHFVSYLDKSYEWLYLGKMVDYIDMI